MIIKMDLEIFLRQWDREGPSHTSTSRQTAHGIDLLSVNDFTFRHQARKSSADHNEQLREDKRRRRESRAWDVGSAYMISSLYLTSSSFHLSDLYYMMMMNDRRRLSLDAFFMHDVNSLLSCSTYPGTSVVFISRWDVSRPTDQTWSFSIYRRDNDESRRARPCDEHVQHYSMTCRSIWHLRLASLPSPDWTKMSRHSIVCRVSCFSLKTHFCTMQW